MRKEERLALPTVGGGGGGDDGLQGEYSWECVVEKIAGSAVELRVAIVLVGNCVVLHSTAFHLLASAMAEAGLCASFGPGDLISQAAFDQQSVIMAARAEVELMMKQIAAQSQAPALFSATLSDACRGQNLEDFVRILVEMGGIGPALCEMHGIGPVSGELQSMQDFKQMTPLDMQLLQGMQGMQGMGMQSLQATAPGMTSFENMQGMQSIQGLNHMAPLDLHSMHGFNHMNSQFAFPFMSSGCQTPRSREQLSSVTPVELELVGTTLVAKTANEYVKLDVRVLKHSTLAAY